MGLSGYIYKSNFKVFSSIFQSGKLEEYQNNKKKRKEKKVRKEELGIQCLGGN
jgi:tRNA(Ile2) C34 agmatinyltransferase TiaS